MNRRVLLTLSGVISAGLVCGCLGRDQSDDEETYTCEYGDAGDPIDIEELPGIDEPAHHIDLNWRENDRFNENYLGVCMDTEPSLPFYTLLPGDVRERHYYRLEDGHTHKVFSVTSEDERDELWELGDPSDYDLDDDDVIENINEVDFDEYVIVVMLTRDRAGGRRPIPTRIENSNNEIHIHAYEHVPEIHGSGTSLREERIAIEYSGDIDSVMVSLTISADERLHFSAENGPINYKKI